MASPYDFNSFNQNLAQSNGGTFFSGTPSVAPNGFDYSRYTQNFASFNNPNNQGTGFGSGLFNTGGGAGGDTNWTKMLMGGEGQVGLLPMGLQAGVGIGNLMLGMSQQKLAKQQFNFTKEAYLQNMANQIKSYNNRVADQINSRYSDREKTQEEKDRIIKDRELKER